LTNYMADWRKKTLTCQQKFHSIYRSCQCIVQMIMMLWNTFIQDSVLMMELRSCHPIWQYTIFSDLAYLSFKR
jgi:hypothetical protein